MSLHDWTKYKFVRNLHWVSTKSAMIGTSLALVEGTQSLVSKPELL